MSMETLQFHALCPSLCILCACNSIFMLKDTFHCKAGMNDEILLYRKQAVLTEEDWIQFEVRVMITGETDCNSI